LSRGHLAYQGPLAQLISEGGGNTECVVKGLSDADRHALEEMGFSVVRNLDAGDTITVPGGTKLKECQRYLWEKNLFCESVTKQAASLEDVIYKRK
jgi:hypothetical protein